MNKKAEFDAIWNWAMSYMYGQFKGSSVGGIFSWSLKTDDTPNSETPAPDGEEYMVMSLYFASGRWGNGEGIYNYRDWADRILTTMRHHPLNTGPTKFGPRTVGAIGSMEEHKMIRFVPNVGKTDFTIHPIIARFYELWARWGPEARIRITLLAAAADTSRSFFQRTVNAKTGLAPDYANFDGTAYSTLLTSAQLISHLMREELK